ncbi:hypothetical protein NMG60_11005892 [Bertholletia excelsa]
MAKVPVNAFLLLRRRAYSTLPSETASVQKEARKAMDSGKEASVAEKKEVFWMRDPNTGYWVPENRFREVDPAALRNDFPFKQAKP